MVLSITTKTILETTDIPKSIKPFIHAELIAIESKTIKPNPVPIDE